MGEHAIQTGQGPDATRGFVRALLDDVAALEHMLAEGLFEKGKRRIGAEQEVFLVDREQRPAGVGEKVLARLSHPQFTTELGVFNLEANLSPRDLGGDCFSQMEAELDGLLAKLRVAAAEEGARVVLCGILPTLSETHLDLAYMVPSPRFLHLNRMMLAERGGRFQTFIKGIDTLQATCDNVMLEACNTSFQVHLQVDADAFARFYNAAQVATAPVLAVAANSPLVLGRRLWHETRIALLQQSLDVRSPARVQRGAKQRVSFGDAWMRESVLEIFRDDVARQRVMVSIDPEESPWQALDEGRAPSLRALRLHNGTVYRWNRPCYGITDGRPHLRIENRTLPAGPTPRDEVANAAFFLGLVYGIESEVGDVSQKMRFEEAHANFTAAARYGLHARLHWFDDPDAEADRLIVDELVPLARHGLEEVGVSKSDADLFLDVIAERARTRRTGAQWALDSVADTAGSRGDAHLRALTAAMSEGAQRGEPVATWEPLRKDGRAPSPDDFRTVGQIMTADVFTLNDDDLVDLAAELMDWKHVRHVPVEDAEGRLVGLISHRTLLRHLTRRSPFDESLVSIRDVMKKDVVSVSPTTSCMEAVETMRRHGVSCLPVVENDQLVGILTERDFIEVTAHLLDDWLKSEG